MWAVLHGIGLLLGLLGAFSSAVLMALPMRDDDVRRRRAIWARRIAPATWLGLILLIASGVALVAHEDEGPATWLVLKHAFVVVILVDATIIHFVLFPRYFRQIGTPEWASTYGRMRAIGMLSVFAWLATLFASGPGRQLLP